MRDILFENLIEKGSTVNCIQRSEVSKKSLPNAQNLKLCYFLTLGVSNPRFGVVKYINCVHLFAVSCTKKILKIKRPDHIRASCRL